nr:MAG TPA: hypothetical protein [Caudoviricetes sp.]
MNNLRKDIDNIVHKYIDRAVYLHHELDMPCELEATINQMVDEIHAFLRRKYILIPNEVLQEFYEAQDSH